MSLPYDAATLTPDHASRRIRKSLVLASRGSGRVRWRTRALRAGFYAEAVSASLRAEKGVRSVEVNPLAASVLVTFDGSIDLRRVEEVVVRALQTPFPTSNASAAREGGNVVRTQSSPHEHHDHVSSPRTLRRDLFIGGIALAGSLAARWALLPMGAGVGATLVALFTAKRYFRGALEEMSERRAGTDVLVTAGVVSALMTGEAITALSIVWLLNIGEYVHALTLRRTRTAIRNLLSADDGYTWLRTDAGDVRVPVATLKPGDVITVYASERVPADGEVTAGEASIDEASITGESTPVLRRAGDHVSAGTTVLSASGFLLRVERLGAETVVGRLIQRVEEAERLHAPIALIGERFSGVFVPSAVLLALGVLLITGNVSSAVTILLMACPCAIGLATPSPVSAAIGNAARRGILIKGGRNLEVAASIDVIVFDKTGTLTLGKPAVARTLVFAEDMTAAGLISIAARAIGHSHHPLSRAIVDHASNDGALAAPLENFTDYPGEGVMADLDGATILVGSARLLERFGVTVPDVELEPLESVVYVALAGSVAGAVTVGNPLRAGAAAAIGALRRLVPDFIMLTGDRAEVAEQIANSLGITEWRAAQSPEEKYALIRERRASGRRVAMIGDGINDAPALAAADLGIAMATGAADVAIDTAGLTLASDDLRSVASTILLSRETVRIIRQNYGMSFAMNAAGVIAGLLGYVNPLIAAILHNAGAIGVVANSSRLIRYEPARTGTIDIENDSCILSEFTLESRDNVFRHS
ncbi:MAG: manganese-transporting P-type ATPase [Thermoanaerobaculia bacterium]|jgi:cation-transporting P-type ATPase C|nr:manganese-transporting P-type ATPase [Thermoanaerobaculia bacterium]